MKHNDDGEYLSLSMHGPDRADILNCADDIARQYFGANTTKVCRYVDRVELVDTDFNGKVIGWTMEVRYKVMKDGTPYFSNEREDCQEVAAKLAPEYYT